MPIATIDKVSERGGKTLIAVSCGERLVPWCAFLQKSDGEPQLRYYGGALSVGYVPRRHPPEHFPFANALWKLLKDGSEQITFIADDAFMDEQDHMPSEPDFLADWESFLLLRKRRAETKK